MRVRFKAIVALVLLCCMIIPTLTKDVRNTYADIKQPRISSKFYSYQRGVDEALYKSMAKVDADYLRRLHPNADTPMFNKGLEVINPMMAFATTWGEAGRSYGGISLTTVMDFDPSTYDISIDWLGVASDLNQVGELWYLCNAAHNVNTNPNSEGYRMPVALLQSPRGGTRESSMMTGLGVGPFQITNSDWDRYKLNERVSPIEAWKVSLGLAGNGWWNNDIEPTSDLTVYAALSLAHQGAGLIKFQELRTLIEKINQPAVQEAFNIVGKEMYEEFEKRAETNPSLATIDVGKKWYDRLVEVSNVNFKAYHVPLGRTNKGWYVATHCLRYIFYKNYFTGGYSD